MIITKFVIVVVPTNSYNINVWHAYNLLFIVRHMAKYLIETLTEENFVAHCQLPEGNTETGSANIESLLIGLIEILVDIPLE